MGFVDSEEWEMGDLTLGSLSGSTVSRVIKEFENGG